MSDFNGKPFKEAMCIEAMRVFDSCSSQDCLEDLAFTFSQADQTVINAAAYIKSTCIDVTDVSFAISPVAFNHYKRLLMLLLHSGNALRFCERSSANVS